jgi:hypothetical protein
MTSGRVPPSGLTPLGRVACYRAAQAARPSRAASRPIRVAPAPAAHADRDTPMASRSIAATRAVIGRASELAVAPDGGRLGIRPRMPIELAAARLLCAAVRQLRFCDPSQACCLLRWERPIPPCDRARMRPASPWRQPALRRVLHCVAALRVPQAPPAAASRTPAGE